MTYINNIPVRRGRRINARQNRNRNRNNRNNNDLDRYLESPNKFGSYSNFRYNSEKFTQYHQPGRFAPDKMRCKLIYQDPTGSRSVTGSAPAQNWRYRSSAYDPDPLLLTGAIPGYAELANLYSEYCVHGMYMDLQVANQDTQSYILVAWPGNSDINSNSLTRDDLAEFSGNVLAKSSILGSVTGQNVAKFKVKALGLQLVGTRFKTDLTYSSSVSTNPVNMFYLNVGAYCPLGNQAFPLVTQVRIYYDIEFFKLRQLES